MDLCHYKGERFEEICSRILEFFFQPNNNHRFQDLWFEALCQVANCKCKQGDAFDMKTQTEEYTDNANKEENKKNRIDLVLKTPSLVVAIENKIEGTLENNPLDIYKEHIENKYPNLNKKFIVLTAKNLSKGDRKKAQDNSFIVIQYSKLFDRVKSLIGKYIASGNQKYLVFMMDFIKTVENKVKIMTQIDLDKFFYNNAVQIDKFVCQYNIWKQRVTQQQKQSIEDNLLNSLTIDDGWILRVSFNDDSEKSRIGIVANYRADEGDALAKFEIYMTTWNVDSWKSYKEEVLKQYPIGKDETWRLDEGKNYNDRVYYHMPIIQRSQFDGNDGNDGNDKYIDAIVERLNEYYRFIQNLANKQNVR